MLGLAVKAEGELQYSNLGLTKEGYFKTNSFQMCTVKFDVSRLMDFYELAKI